MYPARPAPGGQDDCRGLRTRHGHRPGGQPSISGSRRGRASGRLVRLFQPPRQRPRTSTKRPARHDPLLETPWSPQAGHHCRRSALPRSRADGDHLKWAVRRRGICPGATSARRRRVAGREHLPRPGRDPHPGAPGAGRRRPSLATPAGRATGACPIGRGKRAPTPAAASASPR